MLTHFFPGEGKHHMQSMREPSVGSLELLLCVTGCLAAQAHISRLLCVWAFVKGLAVKGSAQI